MACVSGTVVSVRSGAANISFKNDVYKQIWRKLIHEYFQVSKERPFSEQNERIIGDLHNAFNIYEFILIRENRHAGKDPGMVRLQIQAVSK